MIIIELDNTAESITEMVQYLESDKDLPTNHTKSLVKYLKALRKMKEEESTETDDEYEDEIEEGDIINGISDNDAESESSIEDMRPPMTVDELLEVLIMECNDDVKELDRVIKELRDHKRSLKKK
jgi:hypothetical protein